MFRCWPWLRPLWPDMRPRGHAFISQNIANADTPGYKAKDVRRLFRVLEAQAMGQG